MSSSPAGSATPFSDYTSPRSNRGLADVDDNRVLEVYVLKNSADPVMVLVPIARAETYSAFWGVIKNDLYPVPNPGQENENVPVTYLMDHSFMTRLRPELWSDLLPSLRGRRLLVLPGDAVPPPPEGTKQQPPQHKKSTWTSYLTPKSSPIIPETSRVTVDALSLRIPNDPNKLTKTTPQGSPVQEPKARPAFRVLNRTDSFRKTPEFAFDIALWCRFSPAYKPSLLMHVQFREIMLQVVPEQSKGLDVHQLMSKISSALTNMLRRQGCLGVLTSQPMSNFRDLLVKAESLLLALEDWPSCKESLGLTPETLRWIQEPVLLYCEIQDVHFPQTGGQPAKNEKKPILRKVQVECVSEDEVD